MKSSKESITLQNVNEVSTDSIAFYLASEAELHPLLYVEFVYRIIELQCRHKCCALPLIRLEHYNLEMRGKMTAKKEKRQKAA